MSKHRETISIVDLTTGYRGYHGSAVEVTSDISASLLSGELTCLLGPNGAGKSTLLRTLSGFQPPLSGIAMVQGRDITSYSGPELARTIGVVLTEKISLPNMNVTELVALGRSPYTGFWGRLSLHDREIVDEAITLVRIEDLRYRNVSTLSDGERQKVMIAKALAQETPIIFLDEPTAFLDFPSKVEIMQLLRRLSIVKDKTVFLSTHDIDIALQMSDMVWVLDKDSALVTGTPKALAENGTISRCFTRDGISFDPSALSFRILP